MKLSRTAIQNPMLFNIIPLVNVLFLLLIFFTLSSTFVLQPGFAVTLPVSSFLLAPQKDPQIVSITAGVTPRIYFRDQQMSLEQFSKTIKESPMKNRTLIVRADRAVPYDHVMQIMQHGAEAGLSVVLATAEAK